MHELLTDDDAVTSTAIGLSDLMLSGVPFDASVDRIPRHRITEVTLSPIVGQYRCTPETGPEYIDDSGHRLSFDTVIDSVLESRGVVHLPEGASVGVADGVVTSFGLHGAPLAHRFRHLEDHDAFVAAFGCGSPVFEDECFGVHLAIRHYYRAVRKVAQWCPARNDLVFVTWGRCVGLPDS